MFLNKVFILARKPFAWKVMLSVLSLFILFPVLLHVALVYEIIFTFDLFTTFLLPHHDKG